jgi:outer membrane protein OmpA-like peptidoglycan-associated protein
MRFLKSSLLAIVALFSCLSMSAQITEEAYQEALKLGYRPYPYSFVQVQGGVGVTPTNKKFTDLLSPTASVAFGRFFGSGVGARLHVNGWQSKGGFRSIDDTYTFNYINTNADLLLNLTNIFSKSNVHKFNVILVAGIGLNYAWGNDDMDAILGSATLPAENTANAWGDGKSRESLYSHNIRGGLLFDYNISKNWSVGLEVDANSLSDRFNSKYSNRDDWMITAQLGVTYKFGHKSPKKPDPIIEKKVIVPPPVDNVPEVVTPPVETVPEVVTPVVVPEKKDTVVTQPVVQDPIIVPYQTHIFYLESHRDVPDDFQERIGYAKQWADQYPKGKIHVIGYADKGTGIPERNLRYSIERAENVSKALVEAGVPESMIVEVTGMGDTIQPYPDQNDLNRCVIIDCRAD